MQGLLAAGLLAPGCSARDIPMPDPMDRDDGAYQASDPVPEPRRIDVQPNLHVETAWLNGRQLIVHVAWPEAEAEWQLRASTARPVFMVDATRLLGVDGVVPHLLPTPAPDPSGVPSVTRQPAPPPSSAPVAPAAGATKPEVVTEPFAKEPGHYWFLVRGLAAAHAIGVELQFESSEGPVRSSVSLQLSRLDGPVTTTVTTR